MIDYHIAGDFRLGKVFALFARVCRGRKFFRRIILPSESLSHRNFYASKFLHVAACLIIKNQLVLVILSACGVLDRSKLYLVIVVLY